MIHEIILFLDHYSNMGKEEKNVVQHQSSLPLFFHFYNRWAKKRKTPVNLAPRYVYSRPVDSLHGVRARGSVAILVKMVMNRTDVICGRWGKTASVNSSVVQGPNMVIFFSVKITDNNWFPKTRLYVTYI